MGEGFIKASELVGGGNGPLPHAPDPDEINSTIPHNLPTTITTTIAASFIPASKLLLTTTDTEHLNTHTSYESVSMKQGPAEERRMSSKESTPSPSSVTEQEEHPSTSADCGSVASLRRVNVDPVDLYVDASSDEEGVGSGSSVSGPGMGFQLASSLLTVTSPLTTRTNLSSGSQSGSVSSLRPSSSSSAAGRRRSGGGGREEGGKSATGPAKPLPRINNFFER